MTSESTPISRASILGWMLWTAFVLDLAVAGVMSANKVLGFLAFGATLLTVTIGSMDITGRVSVRHRVLRVVGGFAIAAVWPVLSWTSTGGLKPLRVLGLIGAIFAVAWLMYVGLAFTHRRGWIVSSPWRSRITWAVVFSNGALSITKWPADPARTPIFVALFVVLLLATFWPPSRRRSMSASSGSA